MPQLRKYLVLIASFAGLCALLGVPALSTPFLQTRLSLSFVSDRAGAMQIVSSTPGLSPQRSPSRDFVAGANAIDFVVPHWARAVRWRTDGPVATELQASVSFAGVRVPVGPRSIHPIWPVRQMRPGETGLGVGAASGATGPALVIDLPWQELAPAKLAVFALASIASAAILLGLRRSSAQGRMHGFADPLTPAVLAATLLFLVAVSLLIGRIPVSNGEGWDGRVYLNHVQAIAQGGPVPDDPYRLSRMGAFLPAIVAAGHGLARGAVLSVQAVSSLVFAAAAVALFFDFLRALGVRRRDALISSGLFCFSWPLLVMPVFYPMLTDHIALAVSCLSLWLWARGLTPALYVLCAWSVWITPGLFVLPFALAAVPRDEIAAGEAPGLLSKWGVGPRTTHLLLFGVFAVALAGSALLYMSGFSTAEIERSSSRLRFDTLLQWAVVSRALTFLLLVAVSWVWAGLVNSPSLWNSIRWRPLLVASVMVALGLLTTVIVLDWSKGFTGPPILRSVFLQALAAPLKPLVAHTLQFGPVVLFGIAAILVARLDDSRRPWPLICVAAAYLPALAVGSESRQWLPVFPVIVALFALANYPLRLRLACLAAAVGLCIPAIGMSDAVQTAMATGTDFTSPDWQRYFGQQGPWMSVATYRFGLVITTLSAVIGCGLVLSRRRGPLAWRGPSLPFQDRLRCAAEVTSA